MSLTKEQTEEIADLLVPYLPAMLKRIEEISMDEDNF